MMEREGQIALSATEIDHAQAALRRQLGQRIIHEFQEAVNLPELGLLCCLDQSGRGHHADFLHESARLTFGNEVSLAPVMSKHRRRTRRFSAA